MSKRGWLLLGAALPVLALLALLGWAAAKSGGNPGSMGVNREFGQVQVSPKPAQAFSLELLDGTAFTLDDLRGKVVMLDFWASWCAPCRYEAPLLAEVYRGYAGQPVEFVGIDIWDQRQSAIDHVRRYGVTYPNVVDDKGTVAISYGVRGIPEKFFIDQEGTVVRKFVGPVSEETLRSALDALLDPDRRSLPSE